MDRLRISLIVVDFPSASGLVQEVRHLFETADLQAQLYEQTDAGAPPLSDRPDAYMLIVPDRIDATVRNIIRKITSKGTTPLIAVLKTDCTGDLMELFEAGIQDFITPPLKITDLIPRILRLKAHAEQLTHAAGRLKQTLGLREIIGNSPAFAAELSKVPSVALCDSTVLMTGETGTGKEMLARAIHYLGPRSGKPFVPVNCGTLPLDLVENELFGHARGAFTSAVSSQSGIIGEADGGTLFLDEIDTLPLAAQVKLLRFLQDKEYRQLGSPKTLRADVRLIAATNSDLTLAVQQGRFRQDLFYRLNIIPLALPPLRGRRDDVPQLARHFVRMHAERLRKKVADFEPEAMQMLIRYDWPGNIRELQNVIERAVIFAPGETLRTTDINLPRSITFDAESFQSAKARVVMEFEKNYIHSLLLAHQGNITHAARTAGKNRRAFWELLRKHEINVAQFKFLE